jgi:hypothetical protein
MQRQRLSGYLLFKLLFDLPPNLKPSYSKTFNHLKSKENTSWRKKLKRQRLRGLLHILQEEADL